MKLDTPLGEVLHTTKEHLSLLEELGIDTVEDLLLYFPRMHEDLSGMQTIAEAQLNEKVTVRGTVDQIKLVRTRKGKQLVTAKFVDAQGSIADIVWFNQPHIKRMIVNGDDIVLTGKLTENGSKVQFLSPQFERPGDRPLVHGGKLVPVYPQHDRMNTVWLREKMFLVKDAIKLIPETLPDSILKEERLMKRSDAIRALHFPENPEEVQRAMDRLAFEKMMEIQREALERKEEWQGTREERLKIPMDIELIKTFFKSLHFKPTDSQRIAIYEILKDLENDKPMSRLLEGDVGSGKTLVATAVMANVIRYKGQCALMVPTEVLAKQHAMSIGKTLIQFYKFLQSEKTISMHHPVVELLTGSTPKKDAKAIKQRLSARGIDLIIGTHALITDDVRFHDLKLVIVDEQHRFGVMQRQRLKEKGNPHFLAMTATPIPRTLALTAYGHHDLSVLLEKPGNRQKIHTKVVSPNDRKTVELFIDSEIRQGRQVFVICPLISESSKDDMQEIKNVESESARLREGFPTRRIAMLHGQMSSNEKDEIMRCFKEKEFDILVSTAVIEVGIDVPNATIIIIEGAERFGLAQLHQFRGRVGRGDYKSHCFLFTTTPQQSGSVRLKAMEEHDSGFLLAEIDLKLRGPGELFGLRQSGIPEAGLSKLLNPELVVRARRAAEKMMQMVSTG